MIQRSVSVKLLAVAVIASLQVLSVPVLAGPQTATLSGVIRSTADNAPLPGARVFVGDPATGRVVPSPTTGDSGSFTVTDLSPGRYEIAVETGEGLYIVSTPVQLAPGAVQDVQIKVDPDAKADDDDDPAGGGVPPSGTSVWNNPLTASLIVLGGAVVLGFLVENATDDEDDSSPF
jgi:hypothetical protein